MPLRLPAVLATAALVTAGLAPGSVQAETPGASARPAKPAKPVGTVLSSAPLERSLWIPRTTSRAFKLK
jgi:hypothetical protein